MSDIKRDIIKAYMGNRDKLDIDEILDMLEENERLKDTLYFEIDREYKREEVRNEIDYINEQREENGDIKLEIDDDTIEEITERYIDKLSDSADIDWHYILKDTLNLFNIGE